jgi:hypothetical protein
MPLAITPVTPKVAKINGAAFRQRLPDSDKKRLRNKSGRALFFGQFIADERAERLHARINARV